MRYRCILLMSASVVGCLLTPLPASAFIDIPPQTLGSMCRMPDQIAVLKVDKVSPDKDVIIFKHVEQLKGKHDGGGIKHVIPADARGGKLIRDWAAEGKTAVVFYFWQGKGGGHVCIDGLWYRIYSQIAHASKTVPPDVCWFVAEGEPKMLSLYCGTPEKLRDAVEKILKGEEVTVPAIVGDKQAVEEGKAKVQEIRAGLKIVGANEKPGAGEKKPDVVKPGEKTPAIVGTVKAIAANGKSFTLQMPPTEKNKEGMTIEIQLGEKTKITDGKQIVNLAVGQIVTVTLEKGDAKVAMLIQLGKPTEKPTVKPVEKPGKPGLEEKPEAPRPPRDPAKPLRDPAPTAGVIDTEIDKQLAKSKIPASPQADDAEFLRRVTLDLTGRIPTYAQTVAFLDSTDPDKRRKLIDNLLDSRAYSEHFGTVWRNLLVGREGLINGKQRADMLAPWLAKQFDDNRPWNEIVTALLTAEGTPNDNPAVAFLLANGEQGRPQPNKITGSVAAMFLGVNLRCAECHKHPFVHWKQEDFWGMAAFFGKLQYGGAKGGPQTLTEVAGGMITKEKGQPSVAVTGSAIVIPSTSGKAAGQVVKARFLGSELATLDEKEPFRPRFAAWATSADNPYFAKATVNRMWAHFFGRGFVNPLDAFDETNPASHPELLDKLAKEFTASGFDLQHLARCITTSKTYQRTSKSVQGNESDKVAFSHVAVKVLTPEVFFDSVGVIMRTSTDKGANREQFLRDFRFDEEAPATEYIQGIPQLLQLMNGPLLNRNAAVVDRLISSGASHSEAITTLYLTVLSRRPTSDELRLMEGYLSKRKDDREGYRGILWILLNTSEFALNH